MTGLEAFGKVYRRKLHVAKAEHPEEFAWSGDLSADVVADRMIAAFERGSYNKESRAIKATCKELGINHTYTAIRQYLTSTVSE